MTEISEYMSNQDEIVRLNKKVRRLQQLNSKWKRMFEKLKSDNPTIKMTRSIKAKSLVQAWIAGDKSLTFREIAVKCFLSVETVKNISYKLRHAK